MTQEPARRSGPEEKAHLERARKGDKEAFRRLMESSQDRLFGLVYSMVSSREQAEDLIQEIYVKAYFALEEFAGQSSFYTWLYRIASNHCLDFLRKKRPNQISLDHPLSENSEMTFENTLQAPASEAPDSPLEAPSEAAALLGTLDPEQRLILTLRELEGHSYEELADMLNCPVNTVKSRLNRAREALKTAYDRLHSDSNGELARRSKDAEGGPARRSLSEGGNISNPKIVLESREKP